MTFDTAIASLKQGEFVMVYDSDGRESEVDMMVAAEFMHTGTCGKDAATCRWFALSGNFK